MKAVILAGGLGTRLSEETYNKPKPMVEIGGFPIIVHIMRHLYMHGIKDFIICAGYKSHVIKDFFVNYQLYNSDVKIDFALGSVQYKNTKTEDWRVTVVDTGAQTQTGGRLKAVANLVDDDDFLFTYGDGLSNVNIGELVKRHKASNTLATVTAVRPSGRYGALNFDSSGRVVEFKEKPEGEESWINGGYFILKPKAISYIKDEYTPWESEPLEQLCMEKQLSSYRHEGFWHAMDTLRDKNYLENLWSAGRAPWLIRNE